VGQMKKLVTLMFSTAFFASSLAMITPDLAQAAPSLTTCTDFASRTQIALSREQTNCRSFQGAGLWHLQLVDTPLHTGPDFATIRICSDLHSPVHLYLQIRSSCAKYQKSTLYWRAIGSPATPSITGSLARSNDTVLLTITPDRTQTDSPIAYYLIKNLTSGLVTKISKISLGALTQIHISNLAALTHYTFTISAVNIDGTSVTSTASASVTTGATPIPLVAPVFTLSSSSESRSAGSAITGYNISSTGGTIASYSISPAISSTPGLSFSTSTGLMSGTPTTVAAAQSYTITAINASGSSNATFILTVSAFGYSIGDTGPGGGIIYYYLSAGFNCGSTFTATGSPTGGLCHYLEVAPSGWNTGSDPAEDWAVDAYKNSDVPGITNDASENNRSAAIGLGYKNSLAIVIQGNDNTSAAGVARAFNGGALSDWYLPTTAELNQLCKWARAVAWTSDATVCTGGALTNGGFEGDSYWSSSGNDSDFAWTQAFDMGFQDYDFKYFSRHVRPIRAF
jgi:hypothetical protein